jgi:hypothetical protein
MTMFSWLKSLFGSMDRQTVAADRAAKAAEDIADMMENVRDQFRTRLAIEAPAPVVVKPIAAPEEEPEPVKGKGRGK